MRRSTTLFLLTACVLLSSSAPAGARAAWKQRIDRIVAGRAVGVAVREEGKVLYRRDATRSRIPASNEKLLMSMALLDQVGPELTIETTAATVALDQTVVTGDLWLLGEGDPTLAGSNRYAESLRIEATRLGDIARAVRQAGIERVEGSVMGSTGYFSHDWFASGWKSGYPADECPLPSAITYNGNQEGGHHFDNPEFRAAATLTKKLEALGVPVRGRPGADQPPGNLSGLASIESTTLENIMTPMNHDSLNFDAEVLGKRLGVERFGRPGTIAKGARAIRSWASSHGVGLEAHDSSGLSYNNRVAPMGIARLLGIAERSEWGDALRRTLPKAGRGTLEGRMKGIRVRAKTGTLTDISTLSGWVWLRRRSAWAEFSIMSGGMPKTSAADLENRIVRVLTRSAT
ncbi:MAG TPA: D-alanyl-D-alanine carboxypeptidase [Actinomycetota bacterium]|nr:D-alanyl-D-alanine carboxypeptidase [Actinomycetota bacterium]